MSYQIANIKDYGYKDRKKLHKILNILSKVGLVLILLIVYASTIAIAIQSVNKSTDPGTFSGFTLKWYFNMFSKKSLALAIRNTIVTSIIATVISTVLGTLIAIGINSLSPKKRQGLIMMNNVPLLNADIVTGISLMLMFSFLLPLFPYAFGPVTLILAHVFFTLPYVILSVLPKLKEIDKNLIDACLDLGVKPFKAIYKIIVPAIKGGILSGALLAFTVSIDDFVISYYTTGNGFDNLSIWVYSSIGRKSLTPSVYAFSTLLLAVTLGLVLLSQTLLKKGKNKNV
ncbi:MAG: ABC transporter permease [Acholeplasmatales bacterium]|jgi:spermidine/putrescine transport system permease protein|nr:ABC transporter permease [Acholeplasmatales bacterium]